MSSDVSGYATLIGAESVILSKSVTFTFALLTLGNVSLPSPTDYKNGKSILYNFEW